MRFLLLPSAQCLLPSAFFLLHSLHMSETISIAIETSCRRGGVALGIGERLAGCIDFDASSRHATHLVIRLRELLAGQGLHAKDVNEVYVSAGPGSFTGVRVGVTVARTLAQAVPGLRCVSVPSAYAVAQNAANVPWGNRGLTPISSAESVSVPDFLGVILDAKDELVYSQLFSRNAEVREGVREVVPASDPAVLPLMEFLNAAPKPLMLTGEGLRYHKIGACEKGDRHRFQTTKSEPVPFGRPGIR